MTDEVKKKHNTHIVFKRADVEKYLDNDLIDILQILLRRVVAERHSRGYKTRNSYKQILVFRFSAMGDVALTVPAIRKVLDENKTLHITLVSSPRFTPFFNEIVLHCVIS